MKLSDELYLFNEGRNFQAYRLLGAHLTKAGTVFRVWAPNAGSVSVVGDFNGWRGEVNTMHPLGASGARLATTAVSQLHTLGGKYALCTMCIGVGQGIAVILERV